MFLEKLIDFFTGNYKEKVNQDKHKKDHTDDKILSCAKHIIDNGKLVKDNSSKRTIPHVTFQDDKGNTLYISWFAPTYSVDDIKINDMPVPEYCDAKIFAMAQDRIRQLQLEYLDKMIDSVKM